MTLDFVFRTMTGHDTAYWSERSELDWFNAWHTALVRKFGKRAGDVRYTSVATVGDLAPLYAAFCAAGEAWRNHPDNSFARLCGLSKA